MNSGPAYVIYKDEGGRWGQVMILGHEIGCSKQIDYAHESRDEINRALAPLVAKAALADRMAEALKVFAREADQWERNTPKSERLYGRLTGWTAAKWTGAKWSIDQMEATGIEVIDLIKAKEVLAEFDATRGEKG